jgi:hypothetical protein
MAVAAGITWVTAKPEFCSSTGSGDRSAHGATRRCGAVRTHLAVSLRRTICNHSRDRDFLYASSRARQELVRCKTRQRPLGTRVDVMRIVAVIFILIGLGVLFASEVSDSETHQTTQHGGSSYRLFGERVTSHVHDNLSLHDEVRGLYLEGLKYVRYYADINALLSLTSFALIIAGVLLFISARTTAKLRPKDLPEEKAT